MQEITHLILLIFPNGKTTLRQP